MRIFKLTPLVLLVAASLVPAPARPQAAARAGTLPAATLPAATLPDAPQPEASRPQDAVLTASLASVPQNHAPASPSATSPATGSSSTSSSSSPQSEHDKAQQQLQQEEHQRVLGIVPNFGTTYVSDAASLSSGQKFQLAARSAIDPFSFAAAFLVSGINEAFDNDSGFGWGPEGYFKRSGAAYLDSLDGNIIGTWMLPALLHQDPRYFRLGHGTFRHRLLYSIATTVIVKHDHTGRWEPNYSNIGGNIAAGALSNLYYPKSDSSWAYTIGNGLIVTAEGTVGGIFDEFWPDISHRLLHHDVIPRPGPSNDGQTPQVLTPK